MLRGRGYHFKESGQHLPCAAPCPIPEATQALSVVVAEVVVLLCFTCSTLVTTPQAFGGDKQRWGPTQRVVSPKTNC